MNRRDFLRASSFTTLATFAMGKIYANQGSFESSKKKPNIIFFFTDQHRLSAIGAYGKTVCKTPNIDKLAKEGVLFKNTYTSCPMCTPARASIMTGQHVHFHQMTANSKELGCDIDEIYDSNNLISRRLESAGYRCGYTGKWHLGRDEALPSNRGFVGQDVPGHGGGGWHLEEFKKYVNDNNYSHAINKKDNSPAVGRYGIVEGDLETSMPYYLANQTISLIDKFNDERKPFFIWHNNWGPHEPYYVPKKYYDMYKNVKIPEWPNFDWQPDNKYGPHRLKRFNKEKDLNWADFEDAIRHYYAFTTLVDEQIGRIQKHLKETGLADNTIIIFSSDHGESLGSHGGMMDKGFSHYEETQRIGLIIKDPRLDISQRGKQRDELASLLDIHPTVLDYAEAEYDEKSIHGRSLQPLVKGKPVKWRDAVFVEFLGIAGLLTSMITCRYGDMKYGFTCSSKDELYDLDNDPHEMNNLIDHPDYQDAVLMMRKRIYTFMHKTNYPGQGMFIGSRFYEFRDKIKNNDYFVDLEI
jgi:arylsulfatase A-like enzyme